MSQFNLIQLNLIQFNLIQFNLISFLGSPSISPSYPFMRKYGKWVELILRRNMRQRVGKRGGYGVNDSGQEVNDKTWQGLQIN